MTTFVKSAKSAARALYRRAKSLKAPDNKVMALLSKILAVLTSISTQVGGDRDPDVRGDEMLRDF